MQSLMRHSLLQALQRVATHHTCRHHAPLLEVLQVCLQSLQQPGQQQHRQQHQQPQQPQQQSVRSPSFAHQLAASAHRQPALLMQSFCRCFSTQQAPGWRSKQPHKASISTSSRMPELPTSIDGHHQKQQQQQQQPQQQWAEGLVQPLAGQEDQHSAPAQQDQLLWQTTAAYASGSNHKNSSGSSRSTWQPQLQQKHGALSSRQDPSISDSELMSRITAAGSISAIEHLVLQYHPHFKYFHIAAAVHKLPTLDMESSLNMRQRFQHLTSLLAAGSSSVSRLFDAHQAAGCLVALTSPRCLPPLRHGPLLRLLLVLLEDDAAKTWQLHSYELAQCAAAAAALQDALKQQQQLASAEQQQQQQHCLPPQPQLQQQHHQQQQQEGLGSNLPVAFNAVALSDNSSSSSGGSSALALQDPLQRFWRVLCDVIFKNITTFSVDSLALTALSLAAAGQLQQQQPLLLAMLQSGLARQQKWGQSPVAVTRMLRALRLAEQGHEGMLEVLAGAIAGNTAAYSSSQLASAAAAFAHFGFYHEPFLHTVSRAAAGSLKHWDRSDSVTLLTAFESLRYRYEGFLKAAAKALTAAAEAGPHGTAADPAAAATAATAAGAAAVEVGQAGGQLSLDELAASLAAFLELGFKGQALEGLLAATVSCAAQQLPDSPSSLSPSGAIKLLWAAALLEEPAASILPLLLPVLAGKRAKALSQHDLRLLHQAHRLYDKSSWVANGAKGLSGTVGPQSTQQPLDSSAPSTAGSQQQQRQQQVWQQVQPLLRAAQQAAAVYAAGSAARSKQQVRAVQGVFEELGLEAPVTGLKVDGGALQPDLAFLAGGSSSGSNGGSSVGSSGGSSGGLKIALMCDHAGRYSRNAPHELLGFWRAQEWLLEADGWKVVRMPAHEWRLLLQDRGAHAGSDLAYVYNTLLAQGVVL